MYTYVYVCIYILAQVNVSICMYMHVYVCIILYACICTYNSKYVPVYAYMHVYIFNRLIYVKTGFGHHSHTGIMAEVITFHYGDWCSRTDNAKDVLHHFEYLFASKFQERTSSDVF